MPVQDPAQLAQRAVGGRPRVGLGGGLVGLAGAWSTLALLETARAVRAGRGFDPWAEALRVVEPAGVGGWLALGGVLASGALCALGTAALLAARHGALASGEAQE